MNPVMSLRQRYADRMAEAEKMFAVVAEENRGMTEAEEKMDDEIVSDLTSLKSQIERAEAQMERQRGMDVRGGGMDMMLSSGTSLQAGRHKGGKFETFGEQLRAVAAAANPGLGYVTDPRLTAGPSGLNESVGAEGGFLVQQEFAGKLVDNVFDTGKIASRIQRIGVGPNSTGIRMWGLDETSRVNGSRWGGILSYWTGEAQLKTASMPKFRNVRLELDKLTGLCYVTDELLNDSVALESWLAQAFNDEFTFRIEDSAVNGTGAGMPLGVLNSGAVITVTKSASQANTTINAYNILAMWLRLSPRSQSSAIWLVSPDAMAQLWSLYLPVTNVAGTENVGGLPLPQLQMTMPGQNGNPNATLMGLPVISCEYCATLGTVGDLILFDPQQYLAIDKGPMQTASSIHVRFIYDETTFRFVYRYNGMPMQYSALTPYKGSTTTSPYVVLGGRP